MTIVLLVDIMAMAMASLAPSITTSTGDQGSSTGAEVENIEKFTKLKWFPICHFEHVLVQVLSYLTNKNAA